MATLKLDHLLSTSTSSTSNASTNSSSSFVSSLVTLSGRFERPILLGLETHKSVPFWKDRAGVVLWKSMKLSCWRALDALENVHAVRLWKDR